MADASKSCQLEQRSQVLNETTRSVTIDERKKTARKRWQMLAQVLKGSSTTELADSAVSVRRFQSYGLLSTEQNVEENSKEDSDGSSWFSYSCKDLPGFSMKIRHLGGAVSAERLNGFNNTGNVCVWPSEEVMTFYCMQHVGDFKSQQICELGGGMTCLAGIALGISSEAQHIVVSDGNEESVDNLEQIIERNDFGVTSVSARLLRWGATKMDESLRSRFDTVICADCLFFDDGREDLALMIFDLLKPGGQALIFAPSRNKTFHKFAELAEKTFQVTTESEYNAVVWNMHCKMLSEDSDIYDESLHFPIMMKLRKPTEPTESRDTTPESR
ncbi:calmodulin-lysine N-methyltransferase [Aplysia californica]|uniref:Calmodulin-lysine N-methyltransferase n=1 Tax=Aplysia californica TaxID=6500 RepID=A0ABM0JMA3_APLCA|nr:calmodulin-lysine N-methyltransferase [Aplysia californica]